MGPIEIAVILLIAVVLFSPSIIRRRAKDLGQAVAETKKLGSRLIDAEEMNDERN